MKRLLQFLLFAAACLPGVTFAHSASTAYLRASLDAGQLTLEWQVALRDLDALLDLDADRDGRLTWGEVADRAGDIEALAARSLVVRNGAGACTVRYSAPRYARDGELAFAQIAATSLCSPQASPIELEYRLFEGLDPTHRLIAAGRGSVRALAPGESVALDDLAVRRSVDDASKGTGFGGFFITGAEHIVGGLDHLLFLVTLMLPAALLRPGAGKTRHAALLEVGWIVTAFTLAHSLTLAAATFGWLRVPASVVEPLIAATVLLAALNNLWPVVVRRARWVAFAFGLVHGFGFAEVLAPLSLSRAELAQALLAFNLGVEAGQLAIVALGFALLVSIARWDGYRRWVLATGSATIAALAVLWLFDRTAGVDLGGLMQFFPHDANTVTSG